MTRKPVLPTRQQQAIDFIDDHLKRGKSFPTAVALAAHMGWKHESSAYDCLLRLEWRGLVTRTDGVGLGNRKWVWARKTATKELEPA